ENRGRRHSSLPLMAWSNLVSTTSALSPRQTGCQRERLLGRCDLTKPLAVVVFMKLTSPSRHDADFDLARHGSNHVLHAVEHRPFEPIGCSLGLVRVGLDYDLVMDEQHWEGIRALLAALPQKGHRLLDSVCLTALHWRIESMGVGGLVVEKTTAAEQGTAFL